MEITKNEDSTLPLTTKFQHDQREFEVLIHLLEEKLNIRVFLQGNEEYFWENTFSEVDLLQQNKNWNIYEFKEYPLFIHDSLTKKNFNFSVSEQTIEFNFWLTINYGQTEKKLLFPIKLVSKKYDQGLLVQRFLGYSKKIKEEIEEMKENIGKTQKNFNEFQKFQEEKIKETYENMKAQQELIDGRVKEKLEKVEKLSLEISNENKKKWNEFYEQWDKFSEKIMKKIDEIQEQSKFIKTQLRFSDKKSFNILHFSNQDQYSPTSQVLIAEAQKLGITFNITENRGNSLNDQTQAIFNNQDAVLVSVWSGVNCDILGNLLADYVEKGGNVVVVLFSCSTGYTLPKGRFDPPFIAKKDDNNHQSWKILIKDHLLLQGNVSVTAGSDKRRAIVEVNPKAAVEVVAIWNDGVPMMGVRTDLKGIITTLGFQCGDVGSQDGLKVVSNALRIVKY